MRAFSVFVRSKSVAAILASGLTCRGRGNVGWRCNFLERQCLEAVGAFGTAIAESAPRSLAYCQFGSIWRGTIERIRVRKRRASSGDVAGVQTTLQEETCRGKANGV